MEVPVIPRKSEAVITAAKILQHCAIAAFPISVFEIMDKLDIAYITYQELAKKNNCTAEDIARIMESEDGAAYRTRNGLAIAYNDTKLPERVRFTICHEIGHIVLGHFQYVEDRRLSRRSLDALPYGTLEIEANVFARNLLIPPAVYDAKPKGNVNITRAFFGVSKSCANARYSALSHDAACLRGSGMYDIQLEQFAQFVERNPKGVPKNNFCWGSKKGTCGAFIDDPTALKCPYCGATTIRWLEAKLKPLDDFQFDVRRETIGKKIRI